jgi:hypothetical protein
MIPPSETSSAVAQAKLTITAWLEVSACEVSSDEALVYAAVARIRHDFGLRLHVQWRPLEMLFSASWADKGGDAVGELPCAFTAEHRDEARLLACAAVVEVAAWLDRDEDAGRAHGLRMMQDRDWLVRVRADMKSKGASLS